MASPKKSAVKAPTPVVTPVKAVGKLKEVTVSPATFNVLLSSTDRKITLLKGCVRNLGKTGIKPTKITALLNKVDALDKELKNAIGALKVV